MTSEPVIMSSNDQKQQHSAPEDFLRPPQPSFLRPSVSSRDVDAISQGSEAVEGSVISSTTDRYGFLGDHDDPVTKYATPDVDLIRKREAKWLDMFSDWDIYMLRNYKKVRERCRKGIPGSVRARAWIHLCGAKYKMEQTDNKSTFKRLREEKAEQKYVDDIHKDLHRNFPTHELFGGNYEKIGQTELFLVLKAYSVLNPVQGYCQAQAPIAALLLMHMPSEAAFWCLVAVCDNYIPGYYDEGMEAIQLEGAILLGLLRKVSPGIYRHLKKQEIEPILFMMEWFLCVFIRTLPWPSVIRVWDIFMCEGVKILFRVALVLLKFSLPRSVRKKCPSMYETLNVLKNLPESITNEEFLIDQIGKLKITEEDMETEHRKQVELRKKMKQN
ncbi:TBC1 domain family member 10B isoform X2 [Lepeophtheirus salmonis]|nr:TBC1 domain family member 10B-like isoform X2 [Lepeophtheirus salmonis]